MVGLKTPLIPSFTASVCLFNASGMLPPDCDCSCGKENESSAENRRMSPVHMLPRYDDCVDGREASWSISGSNSDSAGSLIGEDEVGWLGEGMRAGCPGE